MPQEFSFDVVSDFDHQELVNAVDQARREIGTRYDFKNLTAEIELEKEQITLTTEGDMQLRAMTDVLKSKFHKRNLDLKILDAQKPENAAKGNLRQVIKLRRGINDELAKKLQKQIRARPPQGAGAHPGRPAAGHRQGQGRPAGGDRQAARGRPRRAPAVHQLPVTRHLTLPNQLTIFRLLLVPVIGYSLSADFAYHAQVSAAVYATAAATDTLDGQIARRRNSVTELGKFLDPLADKILVITVLVILVGQTIIPAWVVVVVFAREFLITGLRFVAANQGVVVASTPWGKSKTLTQNLMIGLLILEQPFPALHITALVMVGLAVTATVLSGLDYLWRYRRFLI